MVIQILPDNLRDNWLLQPADGRVTVEVFVVASEETLVSTLAQLAIRCRAPFRRLNLLPALSTPCLNFRNGD